MSGCSFVIETQTFEKFKNNFLSKCGYNSYLEESLKNFIVEKCQRQCKFSDFTKCEIPMNLEKERIYRTTCFLHCLNITQGKAYPFFISDTNTLSSSEQKERREAYKMLLTELTSQQNGVAVR